MQWDQILEFHIHTRVIRNNSSFVSASQSTTQSNTDSELHDDLDLASIPGKGMVYDSAVINSNFLTRPISLQIKEAKPMWFDSFIWYC